MTEGRGSSWHLADRGTARGTPKTEDFPGPDGNSVAGEKPRCTVVHYATLSGDKERK